MTTPLAARPVQASGLCCRTDPARLKFPPGDLCVALLPESHPLAEIAPRASYQLVEAGLGHFGGLLATLVSDRDQLGLFTLLKFSDH